MKVLFCVLVFLWLGCGACGIFQVIKEEEEELPCKTNWWMIIQVITFLPLGILGMCIL